jgi:hypothetical protein
MQSCWLGIFIAGMEPVCRARLSLELARAAPVPRGAPGLHGVASFVRDDLTAEPPAHCRLVSGHDPFGMVTTLIVSSAMRVRGMRNGKRRQFRSHPDGGHEILPRNRRK